MPSIRTLCGIPRNCPESPGFFPGLCVESDQRSADVVVRSVVTDKYFSPGDVRSAGGSRNCRIADLRRPHLFSRAGVDRKQAAIPRAYVHLPIPNRGASVHSRGIRILGAQAERYLRIEPPQPMPRQGVHRVHARKRIGDVDSSVHNHRFRSHPHRTVNVQRPGQSQVVDVLVVDFLQSAEMALAKISAIHHPVSAVRSVRQDSGFVYVASLCGSIGGRTGDQGEAGEQNCCR